MVDLVYPKDVTARKIGSKARSIVHYKLNSSHWEYKEETGCDFGRDCIIELIENDCWKNKKIEGQIKGTTDIKFILNNEYISYQIKIKTLLYALNSPISFVVFIVDVNSENVYYQCIQDYYEANKQHIDEILSKKQDYFNIRVSVKNKIQNDDIQLQEFAKKNHNIILNN